MRESVSEHLCLSMCVCVVRECLCMCHGGCKCVWV